MSEGGGTCGFRLFVGTQVGSGCGSWVMGLFLVGPSCRGAAYGWGWAVALAGLWRQMVAVTCWLGLMQIVGKGKNQIGSRVTRMCDAF